MIESSTESRSTWDLDASPDAEVHLGVNFNDEWILNGRPTTFVQCNPTPGHFRVTARCVDGGHRIPVMAGRRLRLEGFAACHRCVAYLEITFLGSDGADVAHEHHPLSEMPGGRHAEAYQTVALDIPVPRAASYVEVHVAYGRSVNPVEGLNSFIFLADFRATLPETAVDSLSVLRPFAHLFGLQAEPVEGSLKLFSAELDVDHLSQVRCPVEVRTEGRSTATQVWGPTVDDTRTRATLRHSECNRLEVSVPPSYRYSLFIDDSRVQERLIHHEGSSIVLGSELLDGEFHKVQIRDETGMLVLAEDYLLFPFQQTAWPLLQEHAGLPPNVLSPAAGQRYESLLAHFARVGGTDAVRADVKTIEHAHKVLLKGFAHNTSFVPVTFPDVDSPDVSIVIPVHNKFEVTYFCLCALLFAFNETSFEVVVVDDGSTDRTMSLATYAPNVVIVRNDDATGFVRACNAGAARARGKYIVFLNNDTEPAFRWLDELVASFSLFNGLGLAGSKLLYPDGRLQEAGGIVWRSGNPWNYGRLGNAFEPRFSYSRQVDYVSGAAIMIPSDLWRQIGGFSDEFAPAYFEDTDLAFKVRQAGRSVMMIAPSVVYHFEGVTSGTDVSGGAKRNQEINRPKFKRKWRSAFQTFREEGVDPDLEKDRGILGRVLFIDQQTPRPDMDAGSFAALQEIKLFQRLGYKVTFFATNAAYLGKYTVDLQRLGVEVLHSPFFRSHHEILQQRGREFDIVYIIRYNVAKDILKDVRTFAPRAKILFSNCDLHFLRQIRHAIQTKKRSDMEEAIIVREEELAVMRDVDIALSYNDVEHAVIMSHNLESTKVMKLPWVEEIRDLDMPFDARDGVAFLGGFNHYPNVDAVEFFARKVMPRLLESRPNLDFHIYGSAMPDRIRRLASDRIKPHGYIADVDEMYRSCRVFVAPLLSGAGIKGKVLAALSRGVPCVLSPIAAEGVGLRHGFDCMIAENVDDWVRYVAALMSDRDLWTKISINAQDLIRFSFSADRGLVAMRQIVEALDLPTL